MSKALVELLLTMRQHPAFPELLSTVVAPPIKPFRPAESAETTRQEAEWIFASGRVRQHEIWRMFLTEGNPERGYQPSDKEKL